MWVSSGVTTSLFRAFREGERSLSLFGIRKDAFVKIDELLLEIDHTGFRYNSLV